MNINKAKLADALYARMNDNSYTSNYRAGVQWIHNGLHNGEWDCDEVADSEIAILQEKLGHRDKHIDWLVQDYSKIRDERNKYKQQYAQGCKNQVSLHESLERVTTGNDVLQKKISELTENLEQHREALKQSESRGDILVRDLQQANEHWHRELGASEKKRMELERQLLEPACEPSDDHVKFLQDENEKLRYENRELERRNKELHATSENLLDRINHQNAAIENYSMNVDMKQADIDNLQGEIVGLRGKLHEAYEAMQRLQEEHAKVRHEKFNMELKLDTIREVFE